MRVIGRLLVGLSVLMMLVSCASNEETAGDRAYTLSKKTQGDQRRTQLKTAYINYSRAMKANPNKISKKLRDRFLEMCLVRAKMVLDEGNAQMDAIPLLMDDVEGALTPEVAPELRQQYAAFLVQLSDTSAAKMKFDDALKYIDRAIEKASDPAPFKAKRAEVVKKVAEENLDMAKFEYEEGKKSKETDQLVRAEYYANVALYFDSTNADALKLRSDIRKVNVGTYSAFVSVIETYEDTIVFKKVNKYDILLAVPAIGAKGGASLVHIYNYSFNPLRLRASDFALVDTDGKKYKAISGKMEPEMLDQERETKLKITFPTVSGTIQKLVYENSDGPHYSEKNFQ